MECSEALESPVGGEVARMVQVRKIASKIAHLASNHAGFRLAAGTRGLII
jgi:hypothetical protein